MTDLPGVLSSGGWLLATVVAFGAMILVHELGHFLVAKRAGVVIHTFALGFGPRLYAAQRGQTTYAINLIPFGGYVRMAGEDFAEEEPGEGSFRAKPVGVRMAIVAAGPLMNLALAAVLLAVIAATFGVPVGVTNRIGMLVPVCGQPDGASPPVPCPAALVGLAPGDAIVAIDGRPTPSGQEVVETIHRSPGRQLVLTVERQGRRFEVTVTPRLDPARRVGLIGFAPEIIRRRYAPPAALAWGVQRTGEFVAGFVDAIRNLVREGTLLRHLGGPVAAGRVLVEAGRSGGENFLYVAASLSIIIGLFNLIPIPALDGGRFAFLLVEAVRRRPVDPRREGYVHLVGFVLLFLLLIFLTVQDIQR